MIRTALALAALLAFAACFPASMGPPIDADRVRAFRVGETSRSEAESVLGLPMAESLEGSDSVLTWMHHQRDPAGAHGYRSTIVSLRFGPDGRLKARHGLPEVPGEAAAR